MTIRVAQSGTGIVGGAAVRAIAEHPLLEIVACLAWGEEKLPLVVAAHAVRR
jgi:hypothetical protein